MYNKYMYGIIVAFHVAYLKLISNLESDAWNISITLVSIIIRVL